MTDCRRPQGCSASTSWRPPGRARSRNRGRRRPPRPIRRSRFRPGSQRSPGRRSVTVEVAGHDVVDQERIDAGRRQIAGVDPLLPGGAQAAGRAEEHDQGTRSIIVVEQRAGDQVAVAVAVDVGLHLARAEHRIVGRSGRRRLRGQPAQTQRQRHGQGAAPEHFPADGTLSVHGAHSPSINDPRFGHRAGSESARSTGR